MQHHLKMMSWSHKRFTKHAHILIATLKVLNLRTPLS